MARCRSYLRGLDICVTVLLVVSGVLMIGVGFSSIDGSVPVAKLFEQLSSSDSLLVLQVFGPITVVLSVLGVFAAALDLKPLLLLFSAVVFVELVALVVVASPLVQVQAQLGGAVDELLVSVTPLHRAELYVQRELDKLQTSGSCCGLRSFDDWEDQLPVSCRCSPPSPPPTSDLQLRTESGSSEAQLSSEPCVLVTGDLYPLTRQVSDTMWVHAEPCGPILKSYLGFPIKLCVGVISALATIMMTAIVLSVALGLEKYWKRPPAPADNYNRVTYEATPLPDMTFDPQ